MHLPLWERLLSTLKNPVMNCHGAIDNAGPNA